MGILERRVVIVTGGGRAFAGHTVSSSPAKAPPS
jgi:hypothetical protein